MRRRVISLACCLGALALPPSAVGDDARVVDERRFGDRGIELTIATPAFTAPVKVQVFVPLGYDAQPARRWPVTYYVAGTNHNENDFAEQYSGERLTRSFESIMVSPRGDSGYWSDWYNGGAFGPPQYETFVIDQLIPLIDARFRTDPSGAARAIFGESMGGYGALMLAARHPDMFTAASSLSGAVDTNYEPMWAVNGASPLLQGAFYDAIYGPRATQEIRWRGHNPADLAENLRHVDLQLRTGNGRAIPPDPLEMAVHEQTLRLSAILNGLAIPHAFKDYGAVGHTVSTFEAEIADSLPLLAAAFARRRTPPGTFTFRSIEPSFDVWGWHVEADPQRALEFLRLQVDGRSGLTLAGSGTTSVTTAPLFAGATSVDVTGAGRDIRAVPDAAGRLRFTIDLGPAHTQQQHTPGAPTNLVTRRITFTPHVPAAATARCVSGRSLTIALRRRPGGLIVRAVVLVDGRRARSVRGRDVRRVTLRRLPAGRHRLTIRTRTARGTWRTASRSVRVCARG